MPPTPSSAFNLYADKHYRMFAVFLFTLNHANTHTHRRVFFLGGGRAAGQAFIYAACVIQWPGFQPVQREHPWTNLSQVWLPCTLAVIRLEPYGRRHVPGPRQHM